MNTYKSKNSQNIHQICTLFYSNFACMGPCPRIVLINIKNMYRFAVIGHNVYFHVHRQRNGRRARI